MEYVRLHQLLFTVVLVKKAGKFDRNFSPRHIKIPRINAKCVCNCKYEISVLLQYIGVSNSTENTVLISLSLVQSFPSQVFPKKRQEGEMIQNKSGGRRNAWFYNMRRRVLF